MNQVYESETPLQDWSRSIFMPIPKRNASNKYSHFRLINLMSHALKMFSNHSSTHTYDEQFGFCQGLGTRKALFSLTALLQ